MGQQTIKESSSCNNSKIAFFFVYLSAIIKRFVENNSAEGFWTSVLGENYSPVLESSEHTKQMVPKIDCL